MGHSISLDDSERQPCEVWSRVMGYHRPIASWNIGKQCEHADRTFFTENAMGKGKSKKPPIGGKLNLGGLPGVVAREE